MENMVVQQKFKDGKVIEYTLEELGARVLPTDIINAKYEKHRIAPFFQKDKITGEQWRPYKGELTEKYSRAKELHISNFGRVKIGEEGKIEPQKDISSNLGYLYLENWREIEKELNIKFDFIKFVYQLVAETWLDTHPDDGGTWDVHHITNDGYDNRPENLIWIKRELHNLIPKSK